MNTKKNTSKSTKTTKKINKNINNSKTVKKTSSPKKNSSIKKHEVAYYSCIFRYYMVKNPKTKQDKKTKMWIVIGDGHKRYRKFKTQLQAINYFRSLKKIAKMRIQSSHSKEFVKVIYTFMALQERGMDINEIKLLEKTQEANSKNYDDIVDEKIIELEENDNENILNFNHEEIDKILMQNEENIILDDIDENSSDNELLIHDEITEMDNNVPSEEYYSTSSNIKYEKSKLIDENELTNTNIVTNVIDENKKEEVIINDNESNENEITLNEKEVVITDSIPQIENDNLEEIIYSKNNMDNKNKIYIESEEEVIYSNNLSNFISEKDSENNLDKKDEQPVSRKKHIIYWSVIALICIILAVILILAIVFATKR